jgi:hypothetical protein
MTRNAMRIIQNFNAFWDIRLFCFCPSQIFLTNIQLGSFGFDFFKNKKRRNSPVFLKLFWELYRLIICYSKPKVNKNDPNIAL